MKTMIMDAATLGNNTRLERFSELGELTVYQSTDNSEIAERVKNAEIILCNKMPFNEKTAPGTPNLKLICLFATGYNNIDTELCKRRGITVCNVPDYSRDAVAQHVFALILEHYSRVGDYRRLVADGHWRRAKTFSYFPMPISELAGKTIGIIGFGSIGGKVAEIAKAFGMNVLSHTRTPKTVAGVRFVTLAELLESSDVVTLHCPLTPQSEKMMNAETLSMMKNSAFLVNTSRGGVIDERALAEALKSGKLSGAGLDVLTTEPIAEDCPLTGIDSCIITPHLAWAADEARERLMERVLENAKAYQAGKPINVVS